MIVNYNGVNTKMFAPSIPKSQNLGDFISSSDDVLVSMASSFRWYNDIEEMCKIFQELRQNLIIKISNCYWRQEQERNYCLKSVTIISKIRQRFYVSTIL